MCLCDNTFRPQSNLCHSYPLIVGKESEADIQWKSCKTYPRWLLLRSIKIWCRVAWLWRSTGEFYEANASEKIHTHRGTLRYWPYNITRHSKIYSSSATAQNACHISTWPRDPRGSIKCFPPWANQRMGRISGRKFLRSCTSASYCEYRGPDGRLALCSQGLAHRKASSSSLLARDCWWQGLQLDRGLQTSKTQLSNQIQSITLVCTERKTNSSRDSLFNWLEINCGNPTVPRNVLSGMQPIQAAPCNDPPAFSSWVQHLQTAVEQSHLGSKHRHMVLQTWSNLSTALKFEIGFIGQGSFFVLFNFEGSKKWSRSEVGSEENRCMCW